MAKLIAFGCSATFGHGLPDCFDPPVNPGPNPSKHAWPQAIANQLQLTCVNMSQCGASNQRILDTILNYKFEKSDLVFVMWTFFERGMLYNQNNTHIDLSIEGGESKLWFRVHKQYDLMINSWLQIHHAYLHLKNQGVEFYFLQNKIYKDFFIENRPAWSLDIPYLEHALYDLKMKYNLPMAADKQHPGMLCHQLLADLIVKDIR